MSRRVPLAVFATAVLGACGGRAHIAPYEPKVRDYRSDVTATETASVAPGAILRPGALAYRILSGRRAYGLHDIVTIRVDERAIADRTARTDVDRNGEIGLAADIAGTLGGGGLNTEELVKMRSRRNFDARGRAARQEDVRFNVGATVKKVLPNGNLFIEGYRVVLVSNEEHHFYVSGVARPIDIGADNTIPSSLLADVEIEFVGDGDISENERPGWFSRLWKMINPF